MHQKRNKIKGIREAILSFLGLSISKKEVTDICMHVISHTSPVKSNPI